MTLKLQNILLESFDLGLDRFDGILSDREVQWRLGLQRELVDAIYRLDRICTYPRATVDPGARDDTRKVGVGVGRVDVIKAGKLGHGWGVESPGLDDGDLIIINTPYQTCNFCGGLLH